MKGKPEKLAKNVRRKDKGIEIMIRGRKKEREVKFLCENYIYTHNKSLQQSKQRLI